MYPTLLKLLRVKPLIIADVGASGGLHPRWNFLNRCCQAIGFEPDRRAYELLSTTPNRAWVNAALGDTDGQCSLNLTHAQTASSVLFPNQELVAELFADPDSFAIERTVVVPCKTLDTVSGELGASIAALKLDTQGSELSILRGGIDTLHRTLALVEIEVEFTELYKGQPLFADVDRFMRERGFVLLDLGNFLHHKWRTTKHLCGRKGLLVSADALYVIGEERMVERIRQSVDPLMTLAWACAAVSAYHYPELIVRYSEPWVKAEGEIGSFAANLVQEVTRASYRSKWRQLPGLGRLSQFLRRPPMLLFRTSILPGVPRWAIGRRFSRLALPVVSNACAAMRWAILSSELGSMRTDVARQPCCDWIACRMMQRLNRTLQPR
jgi:FkbM family methyltransferase